MRRTALGLLLIMLCAAGVAAQTAATGLVVGTITDPSGAAIPGATLEITDNATGAARSTTSNQYGQYTFTSLPPGIYTLTVACQGFRRATVSDAKVAVAQSTLLNFRLQVGDLTQTIEVTATAAAELQTVDATIGATVESRSLVDLPMLTRRAVELVFLQPGAQPWTGASSRGSGAIAGTRGDQNLYKFIVNRLDKFRDLTLWIAEHS